MLNAESYPQYNFAFKNFLKREYDFDVSVDRPICKAFLQGHCPAGDQCLDRHKQKSNYNK